MSVMYDVIRRPIYIYLSLEAAPRDNGQPGDKEQYNGLVKDTKYAYCDKSE